MSAEEQLVHLNRLTLRRCSQFFELASERHMFTVVGADLENKCLTELHPFDYDLDSLPDNPMDGKDPIETGRVANFSHTCTRGTRVRLSFEFFLVRDEALDWCHLLQETLELNADDSRRRIRWVPVGFTWNDRGEAWITTAYPLFGTEDLAEVEALLMSLGGAHPATEILIEIF